MEVFTATDYDRYGEGYDLATYASFEAAEAHCEAYARKCGLVEVKDGMYYHRGGWCDVVVRDVRVDFDPASC